LSLLVATGEKLEEKRIRLSGVDCPERRQPFGQKARDAFSGAVFGEEVEVDGNKIDRYGRVVGKILRDGVDNLQMVEQGFCW
jgi:endonuclease YncB( thermonuclease family)